ncbi:PREDICTED: testin [Ceratosolen solmsi marchali]|uniref:Testin n=1 Tax=Ceratosolen solmsi marchali TaxID=326594 RepID=A0AAJ6YKJ0_9HYME|nr:PREDICTED: testin [Ceratosolen solmsi marchali]
MKNQDDKPKWLLELESRKHKPRLAHETGAGASCLNCKLICPGLDLHFWRKICKNCKCRGDDHDIDDYEFPQFKIIFGLNRKEKNNQFVLLQVNDIKELQSQTSFDWIPPDTTKELAADYMKALPLEKLPIKGSAGAVLRRQQLQKQLPLHDIDYKTCDELSEQERKEFKKYLDNLKNCAGQGKVAKLTNIQPFNQSLMTPVNATDVQQFSPQDNEHLSNLNSILNLRTPSNFISKMLQTHSKSNVPFIFSNDNILLTSNIERKEAPYLQANNKVRSQLGQYNYSLPNISNHSNFAEAINISRDYSLQANITNANNKKTYLSKENKSCYELKYSKNPNSFVNEEYAKYKAHKASKPILSDSRTQVENSSCQSEQNFKILSNLSSNTLFTKQILSEALLSPSSVNTSNIVGSSLDEKDLMYIREKPSSKYSNKNDYQNAVVSRELEHISHPSFVLNSEQIMKDFYQIKPFENKPTGLNESNKNEFSSQLLPKPLDHLQAQLSISSLPQSSVIYSEILNNPIFPETACSASNTCQNPENSEKLSEKMEGLTMHDDKLNQCYKCEEVIHSGNVIVTADKIKDAVWHPGCFVCSTCNELLVDLVYFIYKGKLYCGRDLANHLEMPRCFACDELIFVREYTVAENHNYHVKHFCCWDCDIPLAGKQYISENDRPLCLPCYQKNYAKTCNTCNNIIAANQQGVTIKNLNFHATDYCFCCFICKKSLLGGQIAVKRNKPLCSKNCITKLLL